MEKLSVQFSLGDPDGNSRCGLVYKYPAHGGKTKIYFPPFPSLSREGCSRRARLAECGGICPALAFSGFHWNSVAPRFGRRLLLLGDSEGSRRSPAWGWPGFLQEGRRCSPCNRSLVYLAVPGGHAPTKARVSMETHHSATALGLREEERRGDVVLQPLPNHSSRQLRFPKKLSVERCGGE